MANNKDFKVKNGIQPTVYHEGVGTVVSAVEGYSLSAASYDSVDLTVSSQDGTPISITFKPDGTKLYMNGSSTVFQYTLSTAWDLSTASYESKSYNANTQLASGGKAVAFKPDGTKMFILSNSGSYGDDVFRYSLNTAWDVSTASYDSNTVDVEAQETGTTGLALNSDGTKLFILGDSSGEVLVWNMSTAYDLSTASYYSSESLDTSGQDNSPKGMSFSSDGSKLFIMGNQTDKVHKYNLSTAFDLSTASYSNESLLVSSQDTGMRGVALKSDGTKMYTVGLTNDKVYQYSTALLTQTLDLSTGSVFEVTPTSDIQVTLSNPADSGTVSGATLLLDGGGDIYNISGASFDNVTFSVAGQEVNPSGIFIGDDGTKMYICGITGDDVNQYTLSTPYDISIASYSSVYSVATNAANPRKVQFNLDGTKMFVAGQSGVIAEYNLNTAWSVTSASFYSNFSTTSQTATVIAFMFNVDGTKFYVGSGSVLYQYSLSTAFDISTATYDSKSLTTDSQDNQGMHGFRFNNDGTKLISVGAVTDAVYVYSLSTPYDISTATYSSVSFSVASQESTPFDLFFKPDGTKMYIVGTAGDEVNQYTTGTGDYTITYPSTLEFAGGTAPTSPAIGETDVLTISTTDGGTSYQAVQAIDGAK